MNSTNRRIAGFKIAVEIIAINTMRSVDEPEGLVYLAERLISPIFFQTQILIIDLPGVDFAVTTVHETLLSLAFTDVNI